MSREDLTLEVLVKNVARMGAVGNAYLKEIKEATAQAKSLSR